MKEIVKAFQEFVNILKAYWYFSVIYIWWITTSILYFKEKKQREKEKLPFNWAAYLLVAGVLFGLFYGNNVVFKAFFEGLGKILLILVLFLREAILRLPDVIFWVGEIIAPRPGQPILVQIILYLLLLGGVIFLIYVGSVILFSVGLPMMLISGISYVILWLLEDLRKKWFGWFEFKFQHSIPLLSLIFYSATDFTFNFLVESLTRHPLEGVLTVKMSRKTWILLIGSLILLTGIFGKMFW